MAMDFRAAMPERGAKSQKSPPSPREHKPSLGLKNPPVLERSEALHSSHLEAVAKPGRHGRVTLARCPSLNSLRAPRLSHGEPLSDLSTCCTF